MVIKVKVERILHELYWQFAQLFGFTRVNLTPSCSYPFTTTTTTYHGSGIT